MKNLKYISILLIILLSCEEKIEWDFSGDPPDMIVIESMITDQLKVHQIKITKPVIALNEKPEPVTGAEVKIAYIENMDTIFVLFHEEQVNPGMYYTDTLYQPVTWKTYRLLIDYDGKSYYAEQLSYKPSDENEGLYEINFNYGPFANPDAAIWHINLDWSHLPDTVLAPNGTKKARLVYYSLPSIDVSGLFFDNYEKVFFPEGTFIVQEKYSVSEQHAEFLRTMLSETDWQGGLFDTYPANIATNLSEGATGFFATCGYLADTLVVIP